jgi:hypothetical protein
MGSMAEVYDAEMEALAQASAYIASESGTAHSLVDAIHLFSDTTSAIQRIFKGSPGKAQSCSQRFQENIIESLDDNPHIEITLEWFPRSEATKSPID